MDKIKAVKVVRKMTGRGLKEAKDFYDWMDANGDGVSAPKLAGHWCEEHWQDNEICGCPSVGITDGTMLTLDAIEKGTAIQEPRFHSTRADRRVYCTKGEIR